MEMDPARALAALTDLKESGQCTDAQLDGVAETPVSAPPCVDERLGCANLDHVKIKPQDRFSSLVCVHFQ